MKQIEKEFFGFLLGLFGPPLVFALIIFVGLLLYVPPEPKTAESEPPHSNWILVVCDECGGDGIVTYGPDHDFVKIGVAKPGDYGCSMCGGEGELYLEHEK